MSSRTAWMLSHIEAIFKKWGWSGHTPAPYPPMFKAPTLQTFDGKGSPNQHKYYFKSQIGNVVSNDILTRLFISTLKGVAFEWFMKLPAGSMKKWAYLEKLFLV